jgi:hypothetical protein
MCLRFPEAPRAASCVPRALLLFAPLCSLICHCVHLHVLPSPRSLSGVPVVFRSPVAPPFGFALDLGRFSLLPWAVGYVGCGWFFRLL